MRLRRTSQFLALGIAGALLAAGCASSGSSGGDSGSNPAAAGTVGIVGAAQDSGDPVDGGTLTFGSFSFPVSLDPTKTQAAGSNGGSEMAAIYDTLVRVDKESAGFEPQLAKTLESNADFTEFTITLPDGATFSDGSPLDSAAVKWSIDRFVAAKADVAQAWSNIVESIETPDTTTVVFKLKATWTAFPALLAMGPGMIVAKSSEAGGGFTPIGAGPFTLANFAPNEEVLLTPRADYSGGKPRLEKLRFVPTAGAQSQFESLKSGQFDMAYIYRDESAIKQAEESGLSGYRDSIGLGALGIINNREGRPGADLRVRQAIAYGIDPEAVNERVNKGLGVASPDLMAATSRWASDAHGLPFDPAKAKELLEQAKADGYDGKLNYLAVNEQSAEDTALVVQASLNSIGFDVTIERLSSISDLLRKVFVEHDFDMTRSSLSFMDEAPYLRLYGGLGSDSRNNSVGYADAEMDAFLHEVQTSPTEEDKRTAIGQVQERVDETVPYVVWGPAALFVAWQPAVRGMKFAADNTMLFDEAWFEKG